MSRKMPTTKIELGNKKGIDNDKSLGEANSRATTVTKTLRPNVLHDNRDSQSRKNVEKDKSTVINGLKDKSIGKNQHAKTRRNNADNRKSKSVRNIPKRDENKDSMGHYNKDKRISRTERQDAATSTSIDERENNKRVEHATEPIRNVTFTRDEKKDRVENIQNQTANKTVNGEAKSNLDSPETDKINPLKEGVHGKSKGKTGTIHVVKGQNTLYRKREDPPRQIDTVAEKKNKSSVSTKKDEKYKPKIAGEDKTHMTDLNFEDSERIEVVLNNGPDLYNSYNRRMNYDKIMRQRLRKRQAIDQVNKRFIDEKLYGKRLESHRNVQSLMMEEKLALEKLRKSNESGFSETFRTDNSFDRLDKYPLLVDLNKDPSSPTVEDQDTVTNSVIPIRSPNKSFEPNKSTKETIQNRFSVRGSPTFVKEGPLFEKRNRPAENHWKDFEADAKPRIALNNSLSYSEPQLFSVHEQQNEKVNALNTVSYNENTTSKKTLDQKLKYHPQIHSRGKINDHANFYSEINIPFSNSDILKDGNKSYSHKETQMLLSRGNHSDKIHSEKRRQATSKPTMTENVDYYNGKPLGGKQDNIILKISDRADRKYVNDESKADLSFDNAIPKADRYALHTSSSPEAEPKTRQRLSGHSRAIIPYSVSDEVNHERKLTVDAMPANKPFSLRPISPILEIVFEPNDNETKLTLKESPSITNERTSNTTHVYMKSGKIKAYLHDEKDKNENDNEPLSKQQTASVPQLPKDESEIPMYSDDEYDAFPPQRPYTDTYRDYPPFVMGRYEQSKVNGNPPTFDVQAKVNKPGNRRGKRVTFFRNGDKDFRGYPVCINPLQFLNFEALLVYLNDKITTPSGVRYIFSLPDGKEMKSVTDFQQGRSYVVSSVKKPNVELEYGQSREVFWSNRKPSAGRVRKDEIELFKHPSSPSNVAKSKHRVITIKNNEFRHISEKFYVNPNTKQNFEDMLVTMGDMTNVDIHALYTERAPHRKVESFSQLFNEFRNHDNFITCGPEMVPIELDSSKRPAPSSNSSSESMIGATRKKKFQDHYDADLDERLENHDSPSPVQNTYDEAEHDTQQKVMTSRKDRDDCVKFDLRGKLRDYYAPSVTYTNDDGARPNKKLKLEWIYGYAAKETGRNLFVYPTGELLYNVAAVAVFYNHRAKTQRHYLGHTEEISCLALHPNEYWIASGQYAGKESPAHIRIWDGKQLTTFHVIGIGFFNVGVASIGFSEETSGQYLCAVDAGDKHVLSIWEWEKENNGRLVAKTTTTHKTVVCACFYKLNDNLLITYGTEHLYFWSLFPDPMNQKEGKLYRDKHSGNFEDDGVHKQITAHAFSSNGDVITGDSNGSIIVWSRNADYVFKINKEITTNMFGRPKKPELQKAVSALFVMGDNSLLSGGGSTIASWDCNNGYKQISQRDIPEVAGNVRTIIPQRGGGTDGKIYIGTANGCVLGCSISTMFDFIIQGHFDEVWSIATFPEEQSFITAGHDQLVIKWSASSPKSFWRSQVENPCSAVALDPDGQYVAVGSTAGRFFVLNARNGMHVITVQVGKAQINTMSFSRDGAMLAVGCHDGHIHIFYVHDDGKIYRKNNIILRGHAKFVINLDWSFDGRFLQSVDSDFDLLFWNIQRMEREDPRKLKDCNWNTSTCCAGYSTMGPWTTCENGENVSVICRSNYREIIATGDNRGRIKLFKYPCSTHMPACRWTKLYSSTTTALNFIHDDTYVISSAGKPPVLARWAVMDTYTNK